jgi:conjugal transfer pilus assembly protein TraB
MKRIVSAASKIRKSQNLLLYSLIAGMSVVIFALVAALMAGSSSIRKPTPKSYKAPITSGASRVDPKEVYVEKLTTDHELQSKRLDAMEKMLETLIKLNDQSKAPQHIEQTLVMPAQAAYPGATQHRPQDSQLKYQQLSMSAPFDKVAGEIRADLQGVLSDEEKKPQDFIASGNANQPGFPSKGISGKPEKPPRFRSKGIQRTSLMLSNAKTNKNLKTADNTIPAGAFAGAVMVGGVDASTSIQASNDPRPVLLRVIDHGTLPRKFKSDLCGCHVLAACYGDISSERVYMRLEKLTCTERKTGEVVEMSVNGYVAGEDGRAGLRGVVVDRAGESMRNAAIGGFLSGMGNFLSQSHSPITFSPANGLAQTNPMTHPDMLKFGAAKGASGALDKYAEFYIKRAEQMQPVIQVQAGRKVDIVFTQGVAFENSAARGAMIKVNDQQRLSQLHNSSDTTVKPVEAWVPSQESGVRNQESAA